MYPRLSNQALTVLLIILTVGFLLMYLSMPSYAEHLDHDSSESEAIPVCQTPPKIINNVDMFESTLIEFMKILTECSRLAEEFRDKVTELEATNATLRSAEYFRGRKCPVGCKPFDDKSSLLE